MEYISLGDPSRNVDQTDIPSSPAVSHQTEFDDPDKEGRSKKKKTLVEPTLKGIPSCIFGIGKNMRSRLHSKRKRIKGKP